MTNLNDQLKLHIGNLIIKIAELEVENENLKIEKQNQQKLIDDLSSQIASK